MNESVCSIQVTTGMFEGQAHPRNSIGSSKERGFNNSGTQNTSKYVVQIQKEQYEINEMENLERSISPQKILNSPQKKSNTVTYMKSGRSSAANPLNINLGSDTRFSNVGNNMVSEERQMERR